MPCFVYGWQLAEGNRRIEPYTEYQLVQYPLNLKYYFRNGSFLISKLLGVQPSLGERPRECPVFRDLFPVVEGQ